MSSAAPNRIDMRDANTDANANANANPDADTDTDANANSMPHTYAYHLQTDAYAETVVVPLVEC
ncbi:hypothetical protein AGMMS49992_24870 [Clostridia bacterium]|nr:hypothetical protein AGMMS49992_24870 [Clostridia bacterium]